MNEMKGIPPELVMEMSDLGIRPDDAFFLMVKIFASTGKTLEDVVREVGAAIDALRLDSRETVNVIIGGMQAVVERAQEQIRITFYGGNGTVGILTLLDTAAQTAKAAAAANREAVVEARAMTAEWKGMIGQVHARQWKSFWLAVAATALVFSLVFAVIDHWNAYRLERVVAIRNAPEIARAFADSFAGHPLPESSLSDSLESAEMNAAYEKGIGRMPPQLACLLRSVLMDRDYGSPAECDALKLEIERLKREVAKRASVQTVELTDGSRAVRIDEGAPVSFPIQNYEGKYARVYCPPPR